jgi:hypothetical protein
LGRKETAFLDISTKKINIKNKPSKPKKHTISILLRLDGKFHLTETSLVLLPYLSKLTLLKLAKMSAIL